jgi:hypothetical protein
MSSIATILNLACGNPLAPEDDGRARRMQLVIAALLLSLIFAGVWGVAVGSRVPALMAKNAYKLPTIILLSSVFAAPAGLLTWKLGAAQCRASDLLLGFASGVFSGTLVLAVLAPVVALYYASSVWFGPVLAQGAIALSLLTGIIVFARSVLTRTEGKRSTVILPLAVFNVMQIATLLQLVAMFSPILPERTQFDHGIDRVVAPAEGR